MKQWRRPLVSLAIWIGALLAGYLGYTLAENQQFARAEEQRESARAGISNADQLAAAFRRVDKIVEPSVVSIQVVKKGPAVRLPSDDLLRRFFPDGEIPEGMIPHGMNPDEQEIVPEQVGTGSGVIMEVTDGKAYVLTNNHVAGGAEQMTITLADGRQIKNGKVLGTDAKTDLAVIRIDGSHLSAVKWGNSDDLQKGDWVLAFGSPFGYVGSMTHGIVSALNRTDVGILGAGGYESFIQVDAPINPGNSGGPLVNLQGDVVGINTAIASRTGGFQGIGFAIPSNQARIIYSTLKEKGKVVRGWLGIQIRDVAKYPQIAKSFNYNGDTGVLVDQVLPGTPAVNKLAPGDIITEINGKTVRDVQQLRNQVANLPPGTELKLNVYRDGKSQDVSIKLGEQPENLVATRGGGGEGGAEEPNTAESVGIHVQTLNADVAQARGLDVNTGAIVTRVDRNSVAAREGLRVGDVVTKVGNKNIKTADDFAAAMKGVDLKKGVRLYVYSRDIGSHFMFLQSEK